MAQVQEPLTGQKRVHGKSTSKTSTPVTKRPRLSSSISGPVQIPPAVQSPAVSTPTTDKKAARLSTRILDNKPPPTLPQAQPVSLPDHEYQSIAASAVLAASLERSRVNWTLSGILDRYWVKPETGKSAKPPPPNNPEQKWMKPKGECRIRVEPHIFKCEMYVEEKPVPKQYPPQNAYAAQPYRPPPPPPPQQQPQQNPYGQHHQQAHTSRPMNQHQQGIRLPPLRHVTNVPSAAPMPPPPPAQPAPAQSQQQSEKKANSQDPVISALAARASSDPQLQALMKEVATGSATPAQLKVFQRHIDELQTKIKAQKRKDEEEEKRRKEADAAAQAQADTNAGLAGQSESEVIQYDGAADRKPIALTPIPPPTAALYPTQSAPPQAWRPPAPPERPVLLQFVTPGASDDRFLFPRHSILETLSEQHLLVSFILTRKGCDAADPTNLDPDKAYWTPVTFMLEVPIKSEELLDHVWKWVKPANEVKAYMQDIMARAERAPETHLALRLPVKGSTLAETEDAVSKEATPVGAVLEKAKPKSNVKFVKRASTGEAKMASESGKKTAGGVDDRAAAPKPVTVEAEKVQKEAALSAAKADGVTEPKAEEGIIVAGGRPKRTIRQSVRLSDANL